MSFTSQSNDAPRGESFPRDDASSSNDQSLENSKVGAASCDALDLDEISERFLEEYRAGKKPSVEAYAARHPQFAEEIIDLFPALTLLERESANDSLSHYSSSVASKGVEPTDLKQLKNFRIIREIGRGGMGVVYEAWDEALERIVALKVMKIFPGEEEQTLGRFRREARTAASLHHTNIVPVFGYDAVDDHFFYSMQLIDGVSLAEFLNLRERNGLRDDAPTSRFARFVAMARERFGAPTRVGSTTSGDPNDGDGENPRPGVGLADASRLHAPSVNNAATQIENQEEKGNAASDAAETEEGELANVDASPASPPRGRQARDFDAFILKPERPLCATNVVGATYYQRVADLGLQAARALDYASRHNVVHRDIKPSNIIVDQDGALWITDFGLAKRISENDLTRQGQLVGTLRYLAPEALEGAFSPLSDVYSLGLTLYEMLTYVPAFDETNYAKLLAQVSEASPARPRSINPKIPIDLETIILKAIERDPARRYSAAELADDLQRFIEGRPVLARRINPIARAWRWCKRNKLISSLEATIAIMLVAFSAETFCRNLELKESKRITDALNGQLENANQTLNQLVGEKEEETKRANANVQLALDSFDKLSDSILSDSDVKIDLFDDASAFYPAVAESSISRKEANALREMLGFYNDFAKANKDFADNWEMAARTASAFHRLGVINKTLGTGPFIDDLKTAFSFYQVGLDNASRSQNDAAQEEKEDIALEMARLTVVLTDNAPPKEDPFIVDACSAALDALSDVESETNADLRDTLTARLHFSRANFFTRILRRLQQPEEMGFAIQAPIRVDVPPETIRFVEQDFDFVRERVDALQASDDAAKLRLSANYYDVRALWRSFLRRFDDAEQSAAQGERVVAKLFALDPDNPLSYLTRLLALYVKSRVYLEAELAGSPLIPQEEKESALLTARRETFQCAAELAERFPATFNDMCQISARLHFAKLACHVGDYADADDLMKTGKAFVEKMHETSPNVNAKSFAVHFDSSYVEFLVLTHQLDQAREELSQIDDELQKLKEEEEEEVAQAFYERALKHADKARDLVEEADAPNASSAP